MDKERRATANRLVGRCVFCAQNLVESSPFHKNGEGVPLCAGHKALVEECIKFLRALRDLDNPSVRITDEKDREFLICGLQAIKDMRALLSRVGGGSTTKIRITPQPKKVPEATEEESISSPLGEQLWLFELNGTTDISTPPERSSCNHVVANLQDLCAAVRDRRCYNPGNGQAGK